MIAKDENEEIYPSRLFPLSKLDIKHKDITDVVSFARYFGFNLLETLSFLYMELILREASSQTLSKTLITTLDDFFSNRFIKINDKEKNNSKNSFDKLMVLLGNYQKIMRNNDNKAFYEIVYDYYLNCQSDQNIKIASKLLIKNMGFQVLKIRGITEKIIKKYAFLDITPKEKLIDVDWNFLAESLKLHIHIYHIDSKGTITTFNYKEKNAVEKPLHIKILQKNGKFYGLFNSTQNIELDNSIFDGKIPKIIESDGKSFHSIPQNSETSYWEKVRVELNPPPPAEKDPMISENINGKSLIKEEKIEEREIKCCLCYKIIHHIQYFMNPSCKHVYCYECIIEKMEKKQIHNLCYERICSKSLAISQLEKFLFEISLAQTANHQNHEFQSNLIEYDQECMSCHKTDKLYLESFMQFEYYKCSFCYKISCMIHKAPMEKCFCFCLKCFELTGYYDKNTTKRCFNCKEIYCLICSKNSENCSCYCKICGQPDEVVEGMCGNCRKNCYFCQIQYEKEKVFVCEKNQQHIYCRFCAFKDQKFFTNKKICLICKK